MKLGNEDITLKVGSLDVEAVYLGDTLIYTETTPFEGKWLATYSDSSTTSAECDSTSAITQYEIASGAGLISVLIGDCVTNIDNNAFVYKSALSTVTIGSGVTRIGNYAFYSCTSLASITINAETPPSLGSYALNYTNDCPIYVPSESVAAYQSSWSAYSSRIQAIS